LIRFRAAPETKLTVRGKLKTAFVRRKDMEIGIEWLDRLKTFFFL